VTNGTGYFYKVAAVNAVGTSALSNEASATPQAVSAAGYVGRVGSATASTSRTTTTITVGSAGVQGGHALVVSLLLSSTSLTGAVSAKDSAGNTYTVARDVNDGSGGDRVVTLVAFAVKALPAGGTITLTYSSAAETHLTVDELSGVSGLDTSAAAAGTTAAFSSGSATTSQPNDFLFGVVGAESASGTPAWATGWSALPSLNVTTDYLLTAYRNTTTTGAYTANGTSGGQWMATLIALKAG
jgi:hypothetical protein